MNGTGWSVRRLSPRRRLTAWAGVVAVLMVAQLSLVSAGSLAARDEANRALDGTFVFLADVSQERVLSFSTDAEKSVGGLSGKVAGEEDNPTGVLGQLHTVLESTGELGAIAVTYQDGAYMALRRAGSQGGFSAYVITVDGNGVASRMSIEYSSSMVEQSTDAQPMPLKPTEFDRYRAAIGSQTPVWSEPEIDPWTGSTEVWVSHASSASEGDVVVVSAAIELEELAIRLNQLPVDSDGEVSLLSGNRAVIASQSGSEQQRTPEQAAEAAAGTTHPAAPTDGDVWGSNGKFRTLERGLDSHGVDWVLHLRATTAGFNQGFANVREIFRNILLGTGLLTVLSAYILFRLWRPVRVMRDDVERDGLTGLRNRRDFEVVIERALRTTERMGGSVALVMLDVDHFKRINDQFGHASGDRALKSLGRALGFAVRSGDTAMRWGGDEFLLVLLLKGSDDAAANVEGIRMRLAQSLLRVIPNIEGLGVTAGYTVCAQPGADADALVAEADTALVAGKAFGKGATYAAGNL